MQLEKANKLLNKLFFGKNKKAVKAKGKFNFHILLSASLDKNIKNDIKNNKKFYNLHSQKILPHLLNAQNPHINIKTYVSRNTKENNFYKVQKNITEGKNILISNINLKNKILLSNKTKFKYLNFSKKTQTNLSNIALNKKSNIKTVQIVHKKDVDKVNKTYLYESLNSIKIDKKLKYPEVKNQQKTPIDEASNRKLYNNIQIKNKNLIDKNLDNDKNITANIIDKKFFKLKNKINTKNSYSDLEANQKVRKHKGIFLKKTYKNLKFNLVNTNENKIYKQKYQKLDKISFSQNNKLENRSEFNINQNNKEFFKAIKAEYNKNDELILKTSKSKYRSKKIKDSNENIQTIFLNQNIENLEIKIFDNIKSINLEKETIKKPIKSIPIISSKKKIDNFSKTNINNQTNHGNSINKIDNKDIPLDTNQINVREIINSSPAITFLNYKEKKQIKKKHIKEIQIAKSHTKEYKFKKKLNEENIFEKVVSNNETTKKNNEFITTENKINLKDKLIKNLETIQTSSKSAKESNIENSQTSYSESNYNDNYDFGSGEKTYLTKNENSNKNNNFNSNLKRAINMNIKLENLVLKASLINSKFNLTIITDNKNIFNMKNDIENIIAEAGFKKYKLELKNKGEKISKKESYREINVRA